MIHTRSMSLLVLFIACAYGDRAEESVRPRKHVEREIQQHLQNFSSSAMLDVYEGTNRTMDPLTALGLLVAAKFGIAMSGVALVAFKILLGTIWGTVMAGLITKFTDEADRFFLCKTWRAIGADIYANLQLQFPCDGDNQKHEYQTRLAYEVLHGVCNDAEKEGAVAAHAKGWGRRWVQAVNIADPHVLKETAKWTLGWHVLAGELPINLGAEGFAKAMGGGLINIGAVVLLTASFQGSEIKAMLCHYAQSLMNNPGIGEFGLSPEALAQMEEARDYCTAIGLWGSSCPNDDYEDPGMLKNIGNGFLNFAAYAQTKGADFAGKLFQFGLENSNYLHSVFEGTVYVDGFQTVDEHEIVITTGGQGSSQKLTKAQYLRRQKSLYDLALEAAAFEAGATGLQGAELKFKDEKPQTWKVDYSLIMANSNCLGGSPIDLGEVKSVYDCATKVLLEDQCGLGSRFFTDAFKGVKGLGICRCHPTGIEDCTKDAGATYLLKEYGTVDWGTFGAGYRPCTGEGRQLDRRNAGKAVDKAGCQRECEEDVQCNAFSWNANAKRKTAESTHCYLRQDKADDKFCHAPKTCTYQNSYGYDFTDHEDWHFIYNYRGCLDPGDGDALTGVFDPPVSGVKEGDFGV